MNMDAIAEALIDTAAFLELSGDDVIKPDAAIQALESIATSLADASAEEKKALLDLCVARAIALKDSDDPELEKKREFYLGFGEAFGLYPE
jgi:hypothetical protein